MIDNMIAKTYDLRVVSHINDFFVEARPQFFKRQKPNCYRILNGMNGGNRTYMTIQFTCGYYNECKIQGSIRKWYLGGLSDDDLSWNEFNEAINLLAERLEIAPEVFYRFTISKLEVGLNGKIPYDSTYVKLQIVGFRSALYTPLNGVGYRQFSSKSKNFIAKIYDKKAEIRSRIKGLIKDCDDEQFIKQTKQLNIFRVEFTVQNGNGKIDKRFKMKNIGDVMKHYPRLLAFFLNHIKQFQFNDKASLEFVPIKGSVKEFSDFLVSYAANELGAVGIRDIISQLAPSNRREAWRKIKKLQVNTGKKNRLKKEVIGALRKQSIDLFRSEKYKRRIHI